MKPFILGAIFARGGSKGIPHKNVRLLGDKPLIAYAIETARNVPMIDQVIVSTDSEEIAAVARRWGAEIPFMRPAQLAMDDSPEILAWQHAVNAYEALSGKTIDVLIVIPTTAPLRFATDVESCLRKLLETDADLVITVKESERSPYFNMVCLNQDGNAKLVIPSTQVNRRQETPPVFDMTTVAYAARASYVRKMTGLFDGKVKAVVIPKERALDIDTPLDFEIAEYLMRKREKPVGSRGF